MSAKKRPAKKASAAHRGAARADRGAKNKSVASQPAAPTAGNKKEGKKASNQTTSGSEPVNSPELGRKVTRYEAVREKLRLHPLATTQEIVAMFSLGGTKVSPALVERARRQLGG